MYLQSRKEREEVINKKNEREDKKQNELTVAKEVSLLNNLILYLN